LLENDEDSIGGMYYPEVDDPEMSGSSSTLLWELSMLRNHYDPYVSSYCHHLIKGAPSCGPGSLQPDFSRKQDIVIIIIITL
jgi:hypothetical protein